MPGNFLTTNIQLPGTEGKTNQELLYDIRNYIFQVVEQLRYTLNNLGIENFNRDKLEEGTVEGCTVRSILREGGQVGGKLEMCYKNQSNVAGGIQLDDKGNNGEGKYRMFLFTGKADGIPFCMKIKSAGNMSVDSDGSIYLSAPGGKVRIEAEEIELVGTVKINGTEV